MTLLLEAGDFEGEPDFLGLSSRRVFIKGLGHVGLSLLLATLGGCERLFESIRQRPVRRRLRTGSTAVDHDLALYRQAVQAMKQMPAADLRSWASQASIHGTGTQFTFCEHMTGHFFDWHRAYLFHFERICQRLTGDPRFGLPYWNWTLDPAVHPAFLDTAGPLTATRDRTSMTGGMEIPPMGWETVRPSMMTLILGNGDFFTFQQQIESTPHGGVHSWIGGKLVDFNSPLDPLFWAHHCMVDYCWYKWNVEIGNSNPNADEWTQWVNVRFSDRDGLPIETDTRTTLLMPLLSYRYESSAIGIYGAEDASLDAREFERLLARIRAGADLRYVIRSRERLAAGATLDVARPVSLRSRRTVASFARLLESGPAAERIFLSVDHARNPAALDFAVRVFVNRPDADARTPTDDPHYAGSYSFFGRPAPGAPPPEPGHHEHRPHFLVDLTHALQRLRARQALAENDAITVRLVPTPYADQFAAPGTTLDLVAVDLLTTPLILSPPPRAR